ncbi:MAG: winged helix-turn-helix domain-containing protein [Alphaproteobacteria bacterium]
MKLPKKSLQNLNNSDQKTTITFRIDLTNGKAIGPGKINLLEQIDKLGSISAAGKTFGMSYRRAWLLVDDLNHTFKEPLVIAKQGGKGGGNAELTILGKEIIKHYRSIEIQAKEHFLEHLNAFENAL